jgi:hypothetical protein
MGAHLSIALFIALDLPSAKRASELAERRDFEAVIRKYR